MGRKDGYGMIKPDVWRKPAQAPVKFAPTGGFQRELRRRIDSYFSESGRRPRDCPRMYVKTAIMLAALAATYGLLLLFAETWAAAVPLAMLLGGCMAAVGFNVQHDGGHGGYSEHRWVNKLTSLSLDLLGGSSYIWARKHNTIHHSYTNLAEHDDDIDMGLLGRLSPHQRRLGFHRLQQFYMWMLYCLLPVKWHLVDDFRAVATGMIGEHRFARPKGWDLVTLIAGKVVFYSLAFGVPMLMHPVWAVLMLYGVATFMMGLILSVVFQLAHCVEEAGFPQPQEGTGRIQADWASHQIETTVDFGRHNRLLSWLVGGLNFQVEHHLFPHVCHVHYPAIAPIVEQTCEEFGLQYRANPTFRAAVASHFRWLRRMGRPENEPVRSAA